MTEPSADEKPTPAMEFVDQIRSLKERDRGRLAVLKRNAGNTISEAHGVAWIYGLIARQDRAAPDETLFLVASLLASDKAALDGNQFRGNFGLTLGLLKSRPDVSDAAIDRRFAILLDAEFDPSVGGGELPFRLRQMVKLISSKGSIYIDWPQLITDLRSWDHASKFVQKRWAKSYYAPATPNTEEIDNAH